MLSNRNTAIALNNSLEKKKRAKRKEKFRSFSGPENLIITEEIIDYLSRPWTNALLNLVNGPNYLDLEENHGCHHKTEEDVSSSANTVEGLIQIGIIFYHDYFKHGGQIGIFFSNFF